MLSRVRLPLFVALAAFLAGCFQVDTVLTVRPDGSGELHETVSGSGMMGLALLGAFGERAPGDPSARLGEGVTVVSTARDAQPGRARLTTVYAVPDVAALRYSLTNAVDAEMLASTAMTGGLGALAETEDEDTVEDDTTAFRFAFEPGRGGAPAALRVTAPPMELDTPDAPGMGDPEQTEEEGYEAILVMAGEIQMRFAVEVDGTLADTDGGWAEGDRVILTDLDFGPFLEFARTAGGLDGDAMEALAARARSEGVDVPGYRTLAPGVTTIRFR